jgi:hypothetical protein
LTAGAALLAVAVEESRQGQNTREPRCHHA